MTENPKLAAALKLLASTKIWRVNYAPPLYRLFWGYGIPLPPPHFASFWFNVAFLGGAFGLITGLFIVLFTPLFFNLLTAQMASMVTLSDLPSTMFVIPKLAEWNVPTPLAAGIGFGLPMGLFFGVCAASYLSLIARRFHIPSWRTFQPDIA